MSTTVTDNDRLVSRMHHLADELASADRYGVPLPYMVSVSGHEYGGASFHADSPELFDAWADYTEAKVGGYCVDGHTWRTATADVNGLPLEFATRVTEVPAKGAAS